MKRLLFSLVIILCLTMPALAQGEVINIINLSEEIDGYFGGTAGLSPNGTLVAYISRDAGLCTYQIADADVTCTPFSEETDRLSRADRLAWSPDSTKITLTEEFLRFLEEPDIWLFDVTAQTFTNLTDDNTTTSIIDDNEDEPDPLIDLYPVWHPDGSIYFLRILDTEPELTVLLMRISVDNSDTEQVALLPEYFFTGLTRGNPVISPDGTRMAFVLAPRNSEATFGGAYVVDLDDGAFEQVVMLDENLITGSFVDNDTEGRADFSRIPPTAIAWVGEEALLMARNATPLFRVGPGFIYTYIDLETGETIPLIDLSDIDRDALSTQPDALEIDYRSYYPFFALLSADSSRLYYSTTREEENAALLSLPVPPDGTNMPAIEFPYELPLQRDVSEEDGLTQVSDDGRYGLYIGYYLIEFAVEEDK